MTVEELIVQDILEKYEETQSIQETAKAFNRIIKRVHDQQIQDAIKAKKMRQSNYYDYVLQCTLDVICEVFEVTEFDIRHGSRVRSLVDARSAFAMVATDIIGYVGHRNKSSLIAEKINRHHSTILHYWNTRDTYEKDDEWLDRYDTVYRIVEQLTNEFKTEQNGHLQETF